MTKQSVLPSIVAIVATALVTGCGSEQKFESVHVEGALTDIEAATFDQGDKGPSFGDAHPFAGTLVDPDSGDEVGELDGTSVITGLEGRGEKALEQRLGDIEYTLDGGTVSATGIYIAKPDGSLPTEPSHHGITGGTGEYVGARGQVVITPGAEGPVHSLDFEVPSGLAERITGG